MSLLTNSKVPGFNKWMEEQGHAPNGKWVLARNTASIRDRYPNSTILTQSRYDALREEHRRAQRAEIVALAIEQLSFGMSLESAMGHVFEAGRATR